MIERFLTGSQPDEKMQDLSAFVADLGLERSHVILRIFNGGLVGNMRMFGTDRVGIEKTSAHPYLEDVTYGYREELQKRALRFEDGVFAVPFDHFSARFSGLFEHITLGISPHRAAIAIYRAELMLQLSEEFFCFAHPPEKRQALAGILVQPPLPIEIEFRALSLKAKEAFLQEHLNQLDRENIATMSWRRISSISVTITWLSLLLALKSFLM